MHRVTLRRILKIASLLAVAVGLGLLLWVQVLKHTAKKPEGGWVTGVDGINVRPGFTVEKVAASDHVLYPMMAFLDDRGRLFVTESSGKNIPGEQMPKYPECRIRLLEDVDGDGIYERSTIFADRLSLPMGALWYGGSLYVASPPDFLRLDDADADGVSERREVILTGWNIKNTASLHGPYLGPDGWFYLTHGRHGYKIKTKEGKVLEGLASRLWRCRPDGTGLERICGGGFDNPVELVFTNAGEILGTMTYFVDPQYGQRDGLMHFVEGGVYPKWHPAVNEFKRTGDLMPVMTKFARIAPSGLMQYRGTSFGREYRGNLFSAQFNTHRLQRHVLIREGATFRTQDENFVTSPEPDFHPTDVLEDADGSLLFLDTGSWYVDACPLSRVARPEHRGGIYRIRRIGAPQIQDARGQGLNLDRLPPDKLAPYLKDPRPAVRDLSLELLVQKGDASVAPLEGVVRETGSPEAQAAAVFALGRIATARAMNVVRSALSESNFEVRVAAAHVVGLARDRPAVDRLMQVLKSGRPPAQREAATALGRIGDPRAAPALLAAAASSADRFVEHAVIYALIGIKEPAPLIEALRGPQPRARKAALIALDQMEGSPIQREQVLPLLNAADRELRRAALWVLSHHADWSGAVVTFLRDRLRAERLAAEEAGSLREAVVAFSADRALQATVADLLGQRSLSPERQLFLLDTVDRCPLEQFPELWARRLPDQLKYPDPRVRFRTVALIRSRGIDALDEELKRIAADPSESDQLRVAALGVALARHRQLSEADLEFLLERLQPETEAGLRLSAAQAVAQAELRDRQLLLLAQRHLPQADALILPTLLDAFRVARSAEVGEALVAALARSPVSVDVVGSKQIEQLFQKFPRKVRHAARPLLARYQAEQGARVERLKQLEPLLTAGGDIGRGRAIFFGKKVACSTCHTIGAEGGNVGPDLTSLGSIRSGHDILEAVVFPNASFVPGHEVYRVETKAELVSGVLGREEPDAVTLITGPNAELRLPRSQIVSMERSPVSLMPEGLDTSLTREEFTDLLAFLQAQK